MADIIHQPEPELTDYNKLYNTSGYSTTSADVHPLADGHPGSINTNITGYGPLDYGYGMTPTTASTVHSNNAHMAPFSAPPMGPGSTAAAHAAGGRRSSIRNFFTGGDTSNNARQSTHSLPSTGSVHANLDTRRRSSIAKLLSPDSNGPSGDQLGRRRSSAYMLMGYKPDADGNEHKGPYADVSRAQAQHMERIREAEKNLHRTHNVDGLPLPQENGQRRRSSLAHILRLDKPVLAR
ncbi:unnamed protein product [Mortierella alpina]